MTKVDWLRSAQEGYAMSSGPTPAPGSNEKAR